VHEHIGCLMSTVHSEFVAHCMELLGSVGAVRSRRMFGGHGLYVDDLFVALISSERLYLKVDAQTRASFEAAGCTPFVYRSAGAAVSLGYFSAPEEAMESPPLMQPWARHALAAALRARAAKPLAARPARKARPRKGAASSAPTKP
jgi:DNA transformation protein